MPHQVDESLREVIEKLRPMIAKLRDHHTTEENTKAALIEPILEALEWNVRDPGEVDRERRAKQNPVDYDLIVQGMIKIQIEAKGLGEPLKKGYQELIGNAGISGVRWGILTDGDYFRVYNAQCEGDLDEKLFFEVRISDESKNENTVQRLSLLSRSNMAGGLPKIDAEWESYRIYNRVKSALVAMMKPSDPTDKGHQGLINQIRKKAPDLKSKEITAALMQLEIKDAGGNVAVLATESPSPADHENLGTPAAATSAQSSKDPYRSGKPHEGSGWQYFRDLLSSGEPILKDDLISRLVGHGMNERYVQWCLAAAKRPATDNRDPHTGGNPIGFQIVETKNDKGVTTIQRTK